MVTNMAGIETGMAVYDLNGDKIGTVDDVLTVEAHSQNSLNDPYAAGAGGGFGYDQHRFGRQQLHAQSESGGCARYRRQGTVHPL